MASRSVLETEAAETPALAAHQLDRLTRELPVLVARLDHLAPALVATIARGGSDHAATFAGYLFGLQMSLPTASVPPSIASVYGRTLRLDKALVLAISQSGASPDLCAAADSAKAAGAFTLGLINAAESALGRTVDAQIETGAGNERAVAATKSFILTLTALVHLVAAWSRDASASPSLPAIVLAGDRYARPSVEAAVSRLRAAGAPVVLMAAGSNAAQEASAIVAIPQAPDPLLEPVVAAQAAYPFFAALARARGKDPDCARHLRKITRTV